MSVDVRRGCGFPTRIEIHYCLEIRVAGCVFGFVSDLWEMGRVVTLVMR